MHEKRLVGRFSISSRGTGELGRALDTSFAVDGQAMDAGDRNGLLESWRRSGPGGLSRRRSLKVHGPIFISEMRSRVRRT